MAKAKAAGAAASEKKPKQAYQVVAKDAATGEPVEHDIRKPSVTRKDAEGVAAHHTRVHAEKAASFDKEPWLVFEIVEVPAGEAE